MKSIWIPSILMVFCAACGLNPLTSTSSISEVQSASPPTSTVLPSLTDVQLPAGYGTRGSSLEVYFTNPTSPLASQETGGVDGPLVEAIDAARLSVDLAAYSLSLNSVRDALLRAHARGLRVRVVMESDNRGRSDVDQLVEAGIPVLGDRREGLMHNKFVLIDNSEVWTGSMNFTDSGTYEDHNCLIRIRSVKMAENYAREFEEMFVEDRFGPEVVSDTPHPRVILDGMPIDVYFSPDDNVQAGILDLVNNAQESIYFLAFSFTADPIGEALRDQMQEGIIVSGVMDSDQIDSNAGTEFDSFQQACVDVLRDRGEGQMHHKLMIIDEAIVIVGSYNFTNSAETRNDENLLVVYDEDIARRFMEEFERVYALSQAIP